MSFWIENVPVQSLSDGASEHKYSQIDFTNINFHQLNAKGSLIHLSAPKAVFDTANKRMLIEEPVLNFQNSADAKIISASSREGVFYSEVTESSLPSAFRYIILSGSAAVQGENSRVDSDTMLFDNERRFFIFPGSFQLRKGNKSILYKDKEMYYDPIKNIAPPLGELLKSDPELLPLLNSIGKTKP